MSVLSAAQSKNPNKLPRPICRLQRRQNGGLSDLWDRGHKILPEIYVSTITVCNRGRWNDWLENPSYSNSVLPIFFSQEIRTAVLLGQFLIHRQSLCN
jgi:hypothetical protein